MDEAALRRAVEARVARDFQTLNPAAQQRYRAALRAQMRAVRHDAPAEPGSAYGGSGIALLAVATVALVAVAIGVIGAMVLGLVALAVIAGSRSEDAAADPVAGGPGALAAERVMEMHLAAMAQSRRAYYLDESAAGAARPQRSRRVV
jgi:hypothetical protein